MDQHRSALRPLLTAAVGAVVIASFLPLSGCATPNYQHPKPLPTLQTSEAEQQQADSLRHRLAQQQRLNRVAWPLLQANAEICGERVKPTLGIQFANSHSFSATKTTDADTEPSSNKVSLRDTALRTLQLGEAIQVLSVTPGSAADHAQVKAGDRLVSIAGQPFKTGKNGLTQTAKLLRKLTADQPVKLQVLRQQQTLELELTAITACDYPIVLSPTDKINAFADHRSIIITEGMLDFVHDDQNLALVIAHELAHNVLDHIPATIRNGLIGSSVDLFLLSQGIPSPGLFSYAGMTRYSQPFETEADYVALYLLAQTDASLQGSAEFWRKMSRSRPDHISSQASQSHPGSAERYLIMQATIDEISRKRSQQLPLTPNPK